MSSGDGPNLKEPKTGDRRPVNCVACDVTFIRVEFYLHPTHRCVADRHPSNRTKEPFMKHSHNSPTDQAGA